MKFNFRQMLKVPPRYIQKMALAVLIFSEGFAGNNCGPENTLARNNFSPLHFGLRTKISKVSFFIICLPGKFSNFLPDLVMLATKALISP